MVALIYVIIGLYVASRMISWMAESKAVRISDFVFVVPCVVLGWPVLVFVWAMVKAIDTSDKWDKVVIKKKEDKS